MMGTESDKYSDAPMDSSLDLSQGSETSASSPGSTDTPPRAPTRSVSTDRAGADGTPPDAALHSGDILIPRTSRHWEQQKTEIHDLYLKQNKRLQDVIEIMEAQHSFKATSRMYKRQFAKWKWTKYNIQSSRGAAPTGQAFRGAFEKSCTRLRISKRSTSPPSDEARSPRARRGTPAPSRPEFGAKTLAPGLWWYTPRVDDATRLRNRALMALREFLEATHEGYQRESGAAKQFAIGCDFWHLVGLTDLALDKLQGDECHIGGRLLRHIFRDLGKSLDTLCVQTFFGLCVQIPVYILRHNRYDVLSIYLGYLGELGALRFPSHPLVSLVETLKRMSRSSPEILPAWMGSLSRLWVDDLGRIRGPTDIHVLTTRYQVQVTNNLPEDGDAEEGQDEALKLIADFGLLREEAAAFYRASDPAYVFLEDQILHLQWRFDAYEDDFAPRSKRVVSSLVRKHRTANLPLPLWDRQDLMIYQRCLLRLLEFLYRSGEMREANLVATKTIEAVDDRLTLRWSGYLEQLLRWMGRDGDADAIRHRWARLPLLGDLEREDRDELDGVLVEAI